MNDDKEKSLIRSVLTSEVKFVIGIVVFVFGIAKPYYDMRQDIAVINVNIDNINKNHEAHIQDIMNQISDLYKRGDTRDGQIAQLQGELISLLKK